MTDPRASQARASELAWRVEAPLGARSPDRGDIASLTALRGFAALWVFIYHAWVTAGPQRLIIAVGGLSIDVTPLASVGWAGVDIFYVLSGFLLWRAFDGWAAQVAPLPSIARYARHRVFRILPAYYAQLAVLVTVAALTGWIALPSLADLIAHVLLVHAWSYEYLLSTNPVWWTLSIEAQYYVLLPALAWTIRKAGWLPVLMTGALIVLAWRAAAFGFVAQAPIPQRVWLIDQLPGRLDQFLMGMLAAHLTLAKDKTCVRVREWLQRSAAGVAGCIACGPVVLVALAYRLHIDDFYIAYWNGDRWLYFWHSTAGLAVALTILGLALRHPSNQPDGRFDDARGLLRHPLLYLGTVSYSFYLWHELILSFIAARWFAFVTRATAPAFAVQLAVGFVLSLVVATLWYRVFERPFTTARRRG